MAYRSPNKPQYIEDFKTFSEIVNYFMKKKGIKQAALARQSNLSKATISRICRNSNNKGSTYQAKDQRLVMAIAVGLGLSIEEKNKLMSTAFPEQAAWDIILERRMNISNANEFLYEQGLLLLGKDYDK